MQSGTVNEHGSSVKAATRAAPISVDPEGSAAQRGPLSAVGRDLASGISGLASVTRFGRGHGPAGHFSVVVML